MSLVEPRTQEGSPSPSVAQPTVAAQEVPTSRPWRRTFARMFGRPELTFQEAWELERAGQAPPLLRSVRSPAVRESRHRLRAAYQAMPILEHLHTALPSVVVEGSSVNISDHLDGDYWPDERLIRIECHHPIDVIAFTVLHEFGHAVDHITVTDHERARLGHPANVAGWRSIDLRWEDRGEEWFAESFAHWWWPSAVESSRPRWRLAHPPMDAAQASNLFDVKAIAARAGTALPRRRARS